MNIASAITRIKGSGLPLPGDDIDTDQIMPSRFLRRITFAGLEDHIFEDARAGGGHMLDDPRFSGAAILITDRNFGCGSSREHAPQGLRRAGFRAVLGESFGEIFAGNCVSVGLVCAVISREVRLDLARMVAQRPAARIRLDLLEGVVSAEGLDAPITLSEGRRRQFLEGTWDPLDGLLRDAGRLARHDRLLPAVGLA